MTRYGLRVLWENEFEAEVVRDRSDVIVDFFTSTCVPCRKLEPVLVKFQDRMGGSVKVVRVDAEHSSDLVRRYGVQAVPTLLLFREGSYLDRKVGFVVLPELVDWLSK
jgi:thioredoxin 1